MPLGYPQYTGYNGLTKPIVDVWKGLLERARKVKQRYTDRSEQVMSFYSGGPGAMWEADYMNRFMGGTQAITPPRFKITLNIAFEQVAILGPMLFWEMADRKVMPHRSLQLDPMVLAAGNPEAEQYFAQLAQQQAQDDARNDLRARVLEHVLNYFQREQPQGGLVAHSDLAIFEALTKGAGFLRTDHYQFPASDRTLVGSFYVSSDNVLVDADCTDPLWSTANWVAIKHLTRVSETEEHFGLPRGSLAEHATVASHSAAYQVGQKKDEALEVQKDLVEWYEIFSRAGFGNRLLDKKVLPPIPLEFDKARGDNFAYLCICPTCTYPLNLPSAEFEQEYATPDWVKHQTDWPTEYWRDNKWPVEMLSFYPHSGTSPWPEPPLAPALGELTALNVLMSAYVQEAFEGRQRIIAYKKGAIADLQGLLNSDKSPLPIELDPGFKDTIDDVVKFLQRPEINGDLPRTIEFVLSMVEKRTGLSDMMYGGNVGANPRSATEYQGKMDTVNIRPEHMQKKVAAFHSRVADKEVFCAYDHVSSQDIAEQLGPLGMAAWDELVTNEVAEAILRGSKAIVEASGIRRPNKAKDMADLQGLQQYLLPILANHLAQTGDPNPTNGFIQAIGEAGEMDVQGFMLPEPPPNEAAQQQQQLELAKLQAETEKLQADAQKAMAEAQSKSGESAQAENDALIKMQTAEHQMQLNEQKAGLDAAVKEQQMAQKQEAHEQTMDQRQQEARQKLGLKLFEASQKMHNDAQTHLQSSAIADQEAMDQARRNNMITYQKMQNASAIHRQKLQQQGEAS